MGGHRGYTLCTPSPRQHPRAREQPILRTGKCGAGGGGTAPGSATMQSQAPGGPARPLACACQPSEEAPATCGAVLLPFLPLHPSAQANRFLPLDTSRPLCSPQLPSLPCCSAPALPGPHHSLTLDRASTWGLALSLCPHIRNSPSPRTEPRSGVATGPPRPA